MCPSSLNGGVMVEEPFDAIVVVDDAWALRA
jgi:hypothetical protein